jgi:cell division protein FtsL
MHKVKTTAGQTETLVRERRYIYSGESRPNIPGYAVRANRRGVRRKISTFYIILLLFAFGVSILFYINNIITVNQLAFEVSQLEQRYQSIQNLNGDLQAQVTKKAALERIGVIARERLNMQYPPAQPTTLDIDAGNVPEVKRQ